MAFAIDAKQRLGTKIRKAREEKGLSQRQLGRELAQTHLGLKPGTEDYRRGVESMQRGVRRYEAGQHVPRGDLLMAIARATDKPVEHFSLDEDEEVD